MAIACDTRPHLAHPRALNSEEAVCGAMSGESEGLAAGTRDEALIKQQQPEPVYHNAGEEKRTPEKLVLPAMHPATRNLMLVIE